MPKPMTAILVRSNAVYFFRAQDTKHYEAGRFKDVHYAYVYVIVMWHDNRCLSFGFGG